MCRCASNWVWLFFHILLPKHFFSFHKIFLNFFFFGRHTHRVLTATFINFDSNRRNQQNVFIRSLIGHWRSTHVRSDWLSVCSESKFMISGNQMLTLKKVWYQTHRKNDPKNHFTLVGAFFWFQFFANFFLFKSTKGDFDLKIICCTRCLVLTFLLPFCLRAGTPTPTYRPTCTCERIVINEKHTHIFFKWVTQIYKQFVWTIKGGKRRLYVCVCRFKTIIHIW